MLTGRRYGLRPYGPDAFLLDLAPHCEARGRGGDAAVDLAGALARRLRRRSIVVEAVAAYAEVLVVVRRGAAHASVVSLVDTQLAGGLPVGQRAPTPPRTHVFTVRYDGADLAEVATRAGLSADAVVRLHTSTPYKALAVGFQPGFAYLGGLPAELRLPRRARPRARVPAGSVAIATDQTAVYPHESPGGWHLLGSVIARAGSGVADADIAVGDYVRFEALVR